MSLGYTVGRVVSLGYSVGLVVSLGYSVGRVVSLECTVGRVVSLGYTVGRYTGSWLLDNTLDLTCRHCSKKQRLLCTESYEDPV